MEAINAQWRVLKALIIRDLMIRYGRDNIGFAWTVLEPMILCAGVTLIWAIIKQPYEHGIHVITFIITGYMPLTLFRHMTGPFSLILRGNISMLLHRQMSLIDIVLSRVILEFAGTTLALLVIYGILAAFGLVESIYDIRLVLAGWLLLAWFCMGSAFCIAFLTEVFEGGKHFIGPIQYLSVPLSPTFYMLDWMPQIVQKIMYFNPLSHPYEMIRGGIFGPSVTTYYDPIVTLAFGFVYIVVGLYGVESVKDKLHER